MSIVADRPPLSKAFLDAAGPTDVRLFRSEEELRGELGVELFLGVAAEALDPTARVVRVGGRAGRYGALVIATGAAPRSLRSRP